MQLRRADGSDIELLARWNFELIRDEGHRNPMDTEHLAQRMRGWLSSEYTALVFYETEAAVGYALFRRHQEGGIHLRQFFIAREHRRRGLGREAFRLFRESVAKGRVVVEVLANNGPAICFWHAMQMTEYARTLELFPASQSADRAPVEEKPRSSLIELLPVQPTDARVIHDAWGHHRNNFRYLTAAAFDSIGDAERYVSILFQNEHNLAFHILDRNDRRVSGLIKAIVTEHKALVGFVIHEPYWGRGFATEALRLLTEMLEHNPHVSRIWATCALLNAGSIRVLEKCGYLREGVLKNWVTYPAQGGRPFDNYSYVKPN